MNRFVGGNALIWWVLISWQSDSFGFHQNSTRLLLHKSWLCWATDIFVDDLNLKHVSLQNTQCCSQHIQINSKFIYKINIFLLLCTWIDIHFCDPNHVAQYASYDRSFVSERETIERVAKALLWRIYQCSCQYIRHYMGKNIYICIHLCSSQYYVQDI